MTKTRTGFGVLFSVSLVMGCVGHLEFEPHLDAGSTGNNNTVGSGNNNPGNTGGGNNTITSNGTGGWSGTGGVSGTGGQAPTGTGGSNPYGTGGVWADAGAAPADDGGSAGEVATAAAVCPTSINVLTDVFSAKCGGCHGATAPTKNLDMVSAGLGARMVNKLSTCKSLPLIDGTLTGGKPTGLLFQKLAGKVTDCGVQMPAGAAPLSATEMACVNAWAVAAIAKVTGK